MGDKGKRERSGKWHWRFYILQKNELFLYHNKQDKLRLIRSSLETLLTTE